MKRLFILSILILVLSICPRVFAQTAAGPGDQIRVYLVTFGPGADPWEKFGHDCILIQNPQYSPDAAYNWGMFSFGEGIEGALWFGVQFLRGRLLYSMGAEDASLMLPAYKAAGRSILVQELELSAAAKLSLQARLMANDTDANRHYLYDYFKKNCATMCRDQIDQSVAGQVADALKGMPTGTTYRWHDKRVTADTLWLYYFLDYSLGHRVDLPLSAWEESFLPLKLAAHLRNVKVKNESGQWVPLIKAEKQLATGIYPEREVPPASYFYGFTLAGVVGGIVIAAIACFGGKYRVFRWLFILLSMGWSLLAGLLGALMTYAWFSDHAAAKWNENWMHGNPLSLLLVIALPFYFRWPRFTRSVACGVFLISFAGWVAKLTPWAWQVNGEIIGSLLPVHLGIAMGVFVLTSKTSTNISSNKGSPDTGIVESAVI